MQHREHIRIPPPVSVRLDHALALAQQRLARAGLDQPRREARLLAAHLLGVSPGTLLAPDVQLDSVAFEALVARRAGREPLAYITGRQGFWTLTLDVSPDTLIPRADSETLIEAALAALPGRRQVRRVLDLGTGTGCLLLAALSEYTDAFGVGVDLSPAASDLARRNAGASGLASRAAFLAGDWAAALSASFDLILANPPYIDSPAIAGLMPEVGGYESHRALDGGADGLRAYAALMPQLAQRLAPGGVGVLELGAGQEQAVADLAAQAGLSHVATRPDLAGTPRALVVQRPVEKTFGSGAFAS